jgi:hypothetical protein
VALAWTGERGVPQARDRRNRCADVTAVTELGLGLVV